MKDKYYIVKYVKIDKNIQKLSVQNELEIMGNVKGNDFIVEFCFCLFDKPSDSVFVFLEFFEFNFMWNSDVYEIYLDNNYDYRKQLIVAYKISLSLSKFHQLGYAHNNIRPENIVMTSLEQDAIKLIDFSLARQIGSVTLIDPDGYLPIDNFQIARGLFSGLLFGEAECAFDSTASKERDIYAFGIMLSQMEFGNDQVFTEDDQRMMTNYNDRDYCRKYKISKSV